MKFLKVLILTILLFFSLLKPVGAEQKVNLYFFWTPGCPHCAKEKIFLEKIAEKYPQVEIKSLDTSLPENIDLWRLAGERLNTNIGGTPFTVVGEHYFLGYLSDETTGKQIEEILKHALQDGSADILQGEVDLETYQPQSKTLAEKITLPLLGEVKIQSLSLPVLTIVLGLLDGFNPCAMWTLFFLISLLLGMKNRTRMWILGTVFIFVSGLVYFLFMAAWLNFFLLVGLIVWVRLIIGLVALAAGGYNLRDWWVNKNAGCKVTKGEKRKKIFEKIKSIAQAKNFFLALAGIVILAVVVNLVELVCSAGLPAIYTQVLSLSSLKTWQYYLYLTFYIFFFILDDLFVFFVAMVTLRAVGIESKYARFSRLIGGIIITILGFLLLFKPEWLMFG